MAVAIYLTFLSEEHEGKQAGTVCNAEARLKGLAPAVADYTRPAWCSVSRYTYHRGEPYDLGAFNGCTVDLETRAAMLGGEMLRDEDVPGSLTTSYHIEDEP